MAPAKSSNKRRRTRRRRRTPRKGGSSSNPRSRVSSSGLNRVSCLRSFSCYPKQWKKDGKSSWLDSMLRYGSVAMKIFSTLVGNQIGGDTTWQITGTVETFLLGPEDLAWNSPLREESIVSTTTVPGVRGVVTTTFPTLDYQQGRIQHLVVKLTSGSVASKRAGRVVLALQPLTLEYAIEYSNNGKPPPVPSFAQVSLMPGAVSAPYGTTVSQTWRPRTGELGYSYTALGQTGRPSESDPAKGGLAVVAIHVGYQDFASSTPDPTELYAPEEAILNVDVSGSLQLQCWGQRWIRTYPNRGDASEIGAFIGNTRHEIPFSSFEPTPAGLKLPWANMSPTVRALAKVSRESAGTIHFLPSGQDDEYEIVNLNNLRLMSPT